MSTDDISSHADDCLHQFRLLLDIENTIRGDNQTEDGSNWERIDDQRARFEMWAGNVGVFADGHASLDHRLRDTQEAKGLMVNFLVTLSEFIERARQALNIVHSDLPEQSLGDLLEGCEEASSSALSSSFQGTDTESMFLELTEILSPFEQKLQIVERSIDRLYRLSLLIRRPSLARQNPKAENFAIVDEEDNDISQVFADFAHEIIVHQFPTCPEYLTKRLAHGIVIRRKRFLYRQSHQRKLSVKTVYVKRKQDDNQTSPSNRPDSTVRGERVVEQLLPQNDINKWRTARPVAPSQTSASAVNNSLTVDFKAIDEEESRASAIHTTVSSRIHAVAVPKPPKPIQGTKEFECPYCCICLSMSHAKASRWRRHVMEDVQPYVCVFESCKEERVYFSDRANWKSHMQKTHTTHWACALTTHQPCYFETEQDYDDHMWENHKGTFTAAQLILLRKRNRVSGSVIFQACPLCGFSPSTEELSNMSEQVNGQGQASPEMAVVISDNIVKHLASHLEFLALKALPWHDEMDDARTDTAGSKSAEEGTGRSEEGSLSVGEPFSSHSVAENGEQEESMLAVSAEDGSTRDPEEKGCYDTDWGFIPRQYYYGHDRDPILQPLLRKLYLGTSSGMKKLQGPSLPAYLVPLDHDTKFFGRHYALEAIRDALWPSAEIEKASIKPLSFPRCYAIYGPGGMGKTQLAAQFVGTRRKDFDAILWVHAENSSKLAQDFKDIAIGLGLVAADSIDATDLSFTRDALKRWLVNPLKNPEEKHSSNAEKASWLLVFDGVEDGELLNDYWPYNGPGSILITSRNPYSWASSLELKPFTTPEAADYLLQLVQREVSQEDRQAAETIARRLGGLPLALAQMGGIVAHKSLSFSEFLKMYEQRGGKQELLQWSFDTVRPQHSNYEHSVASVWAFDSLGKGAGLVKILSMLDPDGIPENLFSSSNKDSKFPKVAELKQDYRIARNELLERSLVTGNKHEETLFVHRLVQDVSRARMSTSELRRVFFVAVGLVSCRWPFEVFTWRHGIARWAVCEQLFPHVQRLKDLYPEIVPSVDTFEDYAFAKLLVDAGWYCHERGKSADANLFNNMAQSICESLKLRALEHPELTTNMPTVVSELNYSLTEIDHNRGCISSEVNEPIIALKYHKQFNSMMVKESALNPAKPDMRLAISWNELGNANMLNQNFQEAEGCFTKSIEEMKKLPNYQPTLITLPLANLGLAYWLQKRYEIALTTLNEGLQYREEAFGPDDRVSFITGRFHHAIGNVRCSQGFDDEGLHYHRRALLHYKSTLGHRHHRTADLFVKIADHHLRLHQDEMALALLDHAIEAYATSPNFLPERLRASFAREKALRSLDRDIEADAEHAKCVNIYTKLARESGAPKIKPSGIDDGDVTTMVAFWSK